MSINGYKVPPLSRQQIRNIAGILRRQLGLVEVEKIPILMVYESLMSFEVLEYEVCAGAELGEDHARTYPDKCLIQIRESVYMGAHRGVGRDRMTMAHELGHLFLHQHVEPTYSRSMVPVRAFEDPEWQAKCFASEFLIGHDLIAPCLTSIDVRDRFGVSGEAAALCFKNHLKGK